jgi:hypothetical protein
MWKAEMREDTYDRKEYDQRMARKYWWNMIENSN